MIKREFKINFKSFIIWFLVLAGVFLVAYLMYPAIITGENIEMLNEMMKMFPEEVLVAFIILLKNDSRVNFLNGIYK